MVKKPKYTTKFTAVAKCPVKELGQRVALASVDDLRKLLPKDADENPDLFPVVSNLAVVNLGNLNGHAISTEVALAKFKSFKYKFVNCEHDRAELIGVIADAHLTKFSEDYKDGAGSESISEASLKNTKSPFNITYSGYIYSSVAPGIIEAIIESNDPDSEDYLSVSSSWEVGFSDYHLLVGSDRLDDEKAEIITDPAKIEELSIFLKSNGGEGKLPDGRPVFCLICFSKDENGDDDLDSVVFMGVGLTLKPAGAVAGVIAPKIEEGKIEVAAQITESKENIANIDNNKEIISHSEKPPVTVNIRTPMKVLQSLKDVFALTDENKGEFAIANIKHVIESEQSVQLREGIAAAVKEYQDKLDAQAAAEASAKQEAVAATEKTQALEVELKALKDQLEAIAAQQLVAEATQKFNERMAYFDEAYELNDEDREAIASSIQGVSDESYETFSKNFAIFAKDKNKSVIAAKAAAAAPAPIEAVASVTTPTEVAETALETAVAAQTQIPNVVQPEVSLLDKMAKAFGDGGVTIESRKRK